MSRLVPRKWCTRGGDRRLLTSAVRRLAFEQLEDRRVLAVQPFPLPLDAVALDGALIREGTASASIDNAEEVETFTIDLDAGQSITLLVSPAGTLATEVTVTNPSETESAAAGPSAAGEAVLLSNFAATESGTYIIDVAGDPGEDGAFDLRLLVNASLEAEPTSGATNDTDLTAEAIAIGEVTAGRGRGAVLGQLADGAGEEDWFSFALDDGQAATIVLETTAAVSPTIELYHSDGSTLVALGTSAGDSEQAIRGFADDTSEAAAETYFLRVAGADADYSLVVTTDLDVEVPTHDSLATAQDVSRLGSIAGRAAVGEDDFYFVQAEVDDALSITTLTPAAGTLVPVNLIDPQIEVFDPTGTPIPHENVIGNESFSHTVLLSGAYAVRVFTESETGSYVLNITGATGAAPAFEVTSATPADGALVTAPPTELVVDLSDTVFVDSVEATDLIIDGAPGGPLSVAVSVTAIDGDTLAFELPALGDGVYTLSIAAGAMADLDGQLLEPFSIELEVDQTPPQVISSSIAEGAVVLSGDVSVTLGFNEPLADGALDVSDVTLVGQATGAHTAAGLAYDEQTETVSIDYTALPDDEYTLTLTSGDGAFEDLAGNDLDGEANADFPSGDGTPGGDFVLTFKADGPFEVVASTPEDGTVVAAAPAQLVIDFSDTVQLGSVEEADLVIDGDPGGPVTALSVSAVDGDTLAFELPALGDGVYTLAIAAGAMADLDGQLLEPFSIELEIDQTPPQVISSSIAEGAVILSGDLTVTFGFDESLADAALDVADVALVGLATGSHTAASLTYDEQTQSVSIDYTAVPDDEYTLTLTSGDGAFEDLAGNDLDGEANVDFPSGDGTPGGDFVLTFTTDGPFEVVASTPGDGALVTAPPTQLVVDFNDTVFVDSVEAADLVIDGDPGGQLTALSVTPTDDDTLTFDLPALGDGVYTLSIAAGAMADLDGQLLEPFSIELEVDQTPPQVISSSIAEGEVILSGDLTVTFGFDESLADAALDMADVALVGLATGAHAAASLTYDEQTQSVSIDYTALPDDEYTLTLTSGDGAFEDLAGNDLDGEANVDFPSGDGTPGGDFVLTFTTDGPFEVVASTPEDGTVTDTAPPQLTIVLSDQVFIASVDATDLVIDGGPGGPVTADSFLPGGGPDALIFDLPPLDEGIYTLSIAAGAITDLDGQQLEPFSIELEVDQTPPRVISSSVLEGQVIKSGNPIFTIGFDDSLQAETLDAADVQLVGLTSGPQTATSLTYDDLTQTVAIEYTALPEDQYTLTLTSGDDAFEDLAGHDLDGEAGLTFPSGDGTAGGDFAVSFFVDPQAALPIQLERLEPLSGFVFAGQAVGQIDIPGDADRFSFFAREGETIAAVLTSDDPLAILSLELEGLFEPIVAPAPGRAVVVPPELIATAETVFLRVKGTQLTSYTLDVIVNAAVEEFVTFASAGGTLDLDTSLIGLPVGRRLAVVGGTAPQSLVVGNLTDEPNDDLASAVFSGISIGSGVDLYSASGEIGDNPLLAPGLDVDLIQLQLDIGDRVTIDVDAFVNGSTLDSTLILFDSSGRIVALNDDFGPLDSFIDFTAAARDTYFVGVSGFANQNYDPFRAGSGFGGSVGAYDLTIERIPSGGAGGTAVEATVGQQVDVPDVDSYSFSLTGFVGKTADVVLTGRGGSDLQAELLELVGPDGATVLATAEPEPLGGPFTNADLAILSFVVPEDGQYTARFTSQSSGDYVLLVSKSLQFALEPNDLPGDPLRSLVGNTPMAGYLEGPASSGGGQGNTAEEFTEIESNDTLATANPMPLGFDGGEHTELDVLGELTTDDVDYYRVSLEPGDILAASLSGGGSRVSIRDAADNELMGSSQNVSFIYPPDSPLVVPGNAVATAVVATAGDYFIGVTGSPSEYSLNLRVLRNGLESHEIGTRQRLFLDFDGATVDRSLFSGVGLTGTATLSPLVDFLPGWGLSVDDLDTVIDAIVDTVVENVSTDLRASGVNGDYAVSGTPGEFDIEILNSRDHADPFGEPNVTRVVVGGTIQELGKTLIGLAQSIDVGNFDTAETAVVLLDLLSDVTASTNSLNQFALDPLVSIIDLIGAGVGNIVAHEFGHMLGIFHTDQFNATPNITDQGGNLANFVGLVGNVWGDGDEVDVDFGPDVFVANEGFSGVQDSRTIVAFALATGVIDPALVGPSVLSIDPPAGFTGEAVSAITIEFDEPITESSATDPANFGLVEAGPNGEFEGGLGDDVTVPLSILFDGSSIVELSIDPSFAPLGFGRYQLTIEGDSSIEDLDGNPLGSISGPGGGSDFVHQFDVLVIEPGGDLFTITLNTQKPATFATRTPFDDETGDRINTLDPLIIVYNTNGTPLALNRDSRDGKNALLVFQAPANGTYLVQVLPESGTGEYLLEIVTITLSGDYNLDGTVNAADYIVWRNTLGKNVLPQAGADGNGNGTVDEDDYEIWKANFGNTTGSGSASNAAGVSQAASRRHNGFTITVAADPHIVLPLAAKSAAPPNRSNVAAPISAPSVATAPADVTDAASPPGAPASASPAAIVFAVPHDTGSNLPRTVQSTVANERPAATASDASLELVFELLDAELAQRGTASELEFDFDDFDDRADADFPLAVTAALESQLDLRWAP